MNLKLCVPSIINICNILSYYKHLVSSRLKNSLVKCVHLSLIVDIQAGRLAVALVGWAGSCQNRA